MREGCCRAFSSPTAAESPGGPPLPAMAGQLQGVPDYQQQGSRGRLVVETAFPIQAAAPHATPFHRVKMIGIAAEPLGEEMGLGSGDTPGRVQRRRPGGAPWPSSPIRLGSFPPPGQFWGGDYWGATLIGGERPHVRDLRDIIVALAMSKLLPQNILSSVFLGRGKPC
ncbi:hypothetical protein KIL84_021016 [Mauremys mutica]|uniref:Uncharacterized protein n=1 Tax=Mauremys mutica TaxID=74926 RepID=A0A9D3XB53_9SAUR|nr:hypothetical protein KIL84_021016 [Mauremys mutica]